MMAINGARQPLSSAERTLRATALTVAEAARPELAPPIVETIAGRNDPDPPPREFDPDGAPVDRWVASADGLVRWRPVIDRIEVIALPDGARLLRGPGLQARLESAEAAHLGRLLLPREGGR